MADPPELWSFILANLFVFAFGTGLTAFSYVAYRRNEGVHFRNAAVGFGMVTVGGGAIEPLYQTGLKGSYELGGRELLAMQSIEAVLVATGLAMLFYSIYTYTPPTRRLADDWREADERIGE